MTQLAVLTPAQMQALATYATGAIGTVEDLGLMHGPAEVIRYRGLIEATNPRKRERRIYQVTDAGRALWEKLKGGAA